MVVENFRPDVKRRLGIDYPATAQDQSAARLRQHFRLRPGPGPTPTRPGFDQIAQGMGGLMSITGLPGQGPVRVGIPIADLTRRAVLRARHPGRAARAREVRSKGQHVTTSLLQAQIFMLDFQGARWLIDRRGAQAGRQQSSDQHPDRRVQDRRRPHQHRLDRLEDLGAVLRRRSARRDCCSSPDYATAADALEEPRRAQRRDRELHASSAPAPNGSSCSTRPACRAGRSIRSTRCSPIRRSSISAWRRRVKTQGQVASCAWRASRCRCRARRAGWWRAPPELGEHTDAVLKEFGFSAKDIAALRKANAV